jgi:hypothetical protein
LSDVVGTHTSFRIESQQLTLDLSVGGGPGRPDRYVVATVEAGRLNATVVISRADEGWRYLDGFFADLARSWRGWEGTREWGCESLDLQLATTTDRTGHVKLFVTFRRDGGPRFGGWLFEGVARVDAGILDRLSTEAHEFVQALMGDSTPPT